MNAKASNYRAQITTKHAGQLAPVTVDACGHDHIKPEAAAKCAAVRLRAILNGGELPVEASYAVKVRYSVVAKP